MTTKCLKSSLMFSKRSDHIRIKSMFFLILFVYEVENGNLDNKGGKGQVGSRLDFSGLIGHQRSLRKMIISLTWICPISRQD